MQEIEDKTTVWDEQIDRFLTKQMTEAEERAFLRQIDADEEMKSYVAAATLLIARLREQGRQRDRELRSAVCDTGDVRRALGLRSKPSPIVRRSWGVVAIGIAASAGALLGNSYLLRSQALEYAESTGIGNIGAARGVVTAEMADVIASIEAGRDLSGAIAHLDSIFGALPESDTAEYRTAGWYLAVAYIKYGRREEAQEVLMRVIKVCPDFDEAWLLRDKLSRTFFWQ